MNFHSDFMIRTKDDLAHAVEELGFLPFFRNSIPGFSLEEHILPDKWFTDVEGPWEWKGPVIRETGCAYGKFFENKAAFISRKWFPDFANFRRDGYDFDARFEDELASYQDKLLFELLDEHAPVLTGDLKRLGNYKKGGKKGFDTSINRLQAQCYVLVSDFEYCKDKQGNTYGWGVSKYSTPEKFMGEAFTSQVYQCEPEESYKRIVQYLKSILPGETDARIERFLTKGAAPVSRTASVREWLVPSNPKYFDIVSAFEEQDEITWKQGNDNIQVGDTVYMYVGAPYSAILYKCEVTETDIPFHGFDEHVRIKNLMKIKKLETYDPSLLPLKSLAEYGVVTVRCTRSAPELLIRGIKERTL